MKTRKKNPSGAGVARQKPTGQKPTKPTAAKPLRKPPFTLKEERLHRYRALHFPEAAGKKVVRVELVTSSEYHAVVIVFDDNTAVGFEFKPGFTVQAFGEAIDGVGRNATRTWKEIWNERLRNLPQMNADER